MIIPRPLSLLVIVIHCRITQNRAIGFSIVRPQTFSSICSANIKFYRQNFLCVNSVILSRCTLCLHYQVYCRFSSYESLLYIIWIVGLLPNRTEKLAVNSNWFGNALHASFIEAITKRMNLIA